jgi:glyoxylate/hydroxypyruvate reductase
MTKIAFVARGSEGEEAQWLGVLRSALPEVSLLPCRDLDEASRHEIEVAIVANPDPAELRALPRLKWIHSLWAGVERLMAELDGSVPVVRLVDPELSRSMGEAVLAWTLYLQRDMPAYADQQRRKLWTQRPYRAPSECRLAILGTGEMGQAAAARLMAAGFPVTGWNRTPKGADFPVHSGPVGLSRVLEASDIVVCLLPLTAETRGLIDAKALSQMPHGASLINFARGPIVVAADLIDALDRGHLTHAVLDVFDQEPLPEASPLWSHPRITVLPHISATTNVHTAAAIVAGNIRRFLDTGDLPKTVDQTRGY